ncbi:Gamma-glutamyltranspeptidase 3 [Fonsecaea pedrosoi]|nr:Gamma-glutamyltranspeptidase 3 [Fonsecaea pedrosoi]
MLSLLQLAWALVVPPLLQQAGANPLPHIRQPYAPDSLGAVASESSVCSQIGIDLLRNGGNAADAVSELPNNDSKDSRVTISKLVGTVFCTGVIGMYHSGIGGGGFMIVRSSNGSYEVIDFRETAPAAAFQDMYNNNTNASIFGGLARRDAFRLMVVDSGVPGEVRGLAHLHQNYGKLPWTQVMQGAIKTARYGWTVSEDLVRYMESGMASAAVPNFLVDDPNWAIDFAPNGTLLGAGDTITRKRYADTLETIAQQGPDAFYRGPIAEATIAAVQAANGTMTLEDLHNYTVAVRQTANITYRGYRLFSCSAPSSGEVALSVLKTLELYPDFFHAGTVNLSTHRLDEAIRFGYGERTSLGDPSFVHNLSAYQDEMLSDATARDIRSKISDLRTLNVSAYDPAGIESLETPGTSHIVTADASGMAISLTTTINLLFGSQILVPETGVIMNNEMNDFSIPGSSNAFGYVPSPSNYVRPGKRPLSSISPTIVEYGNGTLYYVTGAAGGSRIITATIQSLVHVLDQNMTAPQALAQPRLHDQLIPNQVTFEYAYDNETVAFMKSRGHNISFIAPGQSSAQSIRRLPNGTFEAAGEPRQKNSAGLAI